MKTPLTRFIIKAELEGSASFIRQPNSSHQPVLGENILIKPKISTITAIVIIKRYVKFINFTTSLELELLARSNIVAMLCYIEWITCCAVSCAALVY